VKKTDLQYEFPNDLIALTPAHPSRILLNIHERSPKEISKNDLFDLFQPGDLLVVNETKVIPSRLRSNCGLEFLFIKPTDQNTWRVLFPAKTHSLGDTFDFPEGLQAELVQKGLPQTVKLTKNLDLDYFDRHGLINLPPYILSERKDAKYLEEDKDWYQTAWAKDAGSVAAPTASLHFSNEDLEVLKQKGIKVQKVLLHVGLGTFFPLRTENLEDHDMHFEFVDVPTAVMNQVSETRKQGKRVWALGTTVVRALESVAANKIPLSSSGDHYQGETNLFIYPPYEFQVVNGLLTNFHQPESTLLALVCAFFGTKEVKAAYAYAIEKRFRLFSYGDLSAWIK
tara:strand:+ start:1237 stop:2256 length:1020 start_codon:yes stop_codon:yes gene_type:complete